MERDQLSHDLASLKIDRGAPPAGRRWPRLVAGLIVLAVLVGAGYAFGYRKLRSTLATPEVKIGEVALVSPVQSQVQLTATGYVIAYSALQTYYAQDDWRVTSKLDGESRAAV